DGRNRFDRPGEACFVARAMRRVARAERQTPPRAKIDDAGQVIGVCGLNTDPYSAVPRVGRVRHLYVLVAYRNAGVGQRLGGAVIAAARGPFDTLRLRTSNPAAARLYERVGFRPCADVPDCTHVMELH